MDIAESIETRTADMPYHTDDTELAKFKTTLGNHLGELFKSAERDRSEIEQEWIRDLRQFKGKYDPETLAQMHPKRSKAFLAITRTKVKAITARICDILFPSGGERNWSINPTPVPELDPKLIEQISSQIEAITGQPPTELEVRNIVFEEATKRSHDMQLEIDDQLTELKYREIIRQIIHSGSLYGTGILKGPLVKKNISRRWVSGNQNGWGTIGIESLSPFCENVSIWDCYPDMSVSDIEDADYIFQRHVMPKHKLVALKNRPGFNGDVIDAYIKLYKDGDRTAKNHETSLSDLSGDGLGITSMSSHSNKYELVEYWGYLNADQLAEQGVVVEKEKLGTIVAANVWLLGGHVIKAVISPLEGINFPYYFYYFDKDETSIWGEGIPRIMRDPQKLYNSSIRALLDNAATAAGPYIEANTDLLAPDEDPTDLYPFRVFQRTGTGVEATAKAINIYDIPSHTTEFMALANFFMSASDEVTTIPRHMYGETANLSSASRTASGLSMLMGAANITVKDQVKNFDEGITKRFIRMMYFWNMDFNPKQNIKGDFNIKAEGSNSLIAKEVMMEKLIQWLGMTNNPIDLQYINRDVALRETAKAMELTTLNLVKTADQIKQEQKDAADAAASQQAKMMEVEKLKAASSGHVDQGGESIRPTMERLPTRELLNGAVPEVTSRDISQM